MYDFLMWLWGFIVGAAFGSWVIVRVLRKLRKVGF
jgi:hypothetical protein